MNLFGAGQPFAWRRHRNPPPVEPAPIPPYQDPRLWAPKLDRETALHLQLQSIQSGIGEVAERGIRDDPDVNRRIERMYARIREIRGELDT